MRSACSAWAASSAGAAREPRRARPDVLGYLGVAPLLLLEERRVLAAHLVHEPLIFSRIAGSMPALECVNRVSWMAGSAAPPELAAAAAPPEELAAMLAAASADKADRSRAATNPKPCECEHLLTRAPC